MYNRQRQNWPDFTYNLADLEHDLLLFSEKTGWVSGMLAGLPDELRQDAEIEIILAEAIKTSAIEGEYPNPTDVLSSIRKNLGLGQPASRVRDKSAAGLGELMAVVRKTFRDPLTEETLFAWHRLLMSGHTKIKAGKWRTHKDPMQVISGAIGREVVHFEAPPSSRVPREMKTFIRWFNATGPGESKAIKSAPVRAAIAHLYFESIHPFEDGNGRIGRALAEKALSQTIGRPVMLSLSRTIEARRQHYYASLKEAQQTNDITQWIRYFVHVTLDAQAEAETQIAFTLKKVKFFDQYKDILNDRQNVVIRRMLEAGPDGFEGGMNARKYQAIAHTSKATATRDMQELLKMGAFRLVGSSGGRSTRYEVNV